MPKKWIPLPVAEYTPDMPAFNNPGSANIRNCIPRTPQSYGPMPDLAPFGGALPARCQGAISVSDTNANTYTFAGDATDLFEYSAGSTNPSSVSQSVGAYNCVSDGQWNFDFMGQRVLATDFADAIQSFTLGASSKFSDLANGGITGLALTPGSGYTNGTYALAVTGGGIGTGFAGTVTVAGGALSTWAITSPGKNYPQTATIGIPAGAGAGTDGAITPNIALIAPQAKYMAVVDNFLMLGFTNDPVSGTQAQRVWWSGLNDPTNWPTPGTSAAAEFQSSYDDLFGDFGPISGIVGALGTADCAIFFERAIFRGVYAGPPVVFDFFPCETVRGTNMPNAIVKRGLYVDYIGEDGFYTFDGTNSRPIGANKIDKTFYADLDQNHLDRVYGAVDPVNRLTLWAYPGQGNNNGIPNRIVVYNWVLDRFSIIDMPDGLDLIFRSLTFGFTLDDMPGGTLDEIQLPLDSRAWTGGSMILSGFDENHALGYFNGPSLAPTIETSEQAPFNPMLTHISDTRPLVDGGNPSVSLAFRNRLKDAPVYNVKSALNDFGTCPQLANGRYVRAQAMLNAGDSWQHFQGVEVYASPNGMQ